MRELFWCSFGLNLVLAVCLIVAMNATPAQRDPLPKHAIVLRDTDEVANFVRERISYADTENGGRVHIGINCAVRSGEGCATGTIIELKNDGHFVTPAELAADIEKLTTDLDVETASRQLADTILFESDRRQDTIIADIRRWIEQMYAWAVIVTKCLNEKCACDGAKSQSVPVFLESP